MRKIHILYVTESLEKGGAEKRLLYDLRKLDRTSFEPRVCHLYPSDGFKGEMLSLGIPVHWLGLEKISGWLRGVFSLRRLIREHQADLIHTQLFGANMIGRIAGRLSGVPVVTTIQSSAYEPDIPYFRSYRRKWVDTWTGRWGTQKFIAVSQFAKESASRRLGFREEDITVIYNTVDPEEFSPSLDKQVLRQQFGFAEGEILLICVGKLNPPKGQHTLIKALPRILPDFPHLKLLLLGEGPSRPELERLGRSLRLENHLLFLGRRNDVKELLMMSDLFVFPTVSEGMPLALLEAMAMKKPCVASDIPPIREVIRDRESGLLVQPENPDAMAEAILELLRAPEEAEALGARARGVVIEKFSGETCTQQLEALYREVMNGRFGRTPACTK